MKGAERQKVQKVYQRTIRMFARPPPLQEGASIVIRTRLPRNLALAPVLTHRYLGYLKRTGPPGVMYCGVTWVNVTRGPAPTER
jgi:hypothetical protein